MFPGPSRVWHPVWCSRSVSLRQVSGDPTNCFTLGDQIAPLLEKLGKLHCLVDNRIHMQQAAGTTKVSYNAYYNHKLA